MTSETAAPVTPERIYQLAWGYAPPLILEAALRHRVFDVLDGGAKSLKEIHEATGASERGLYPILNFLVGMSFLAKDSEGKFTLTPESATFLVSTKPTFSGGLIRHCSEHLVPRWLHLNETVGTGKPYTPVNQEHGGAEFFESFVTDIFPMSYRVAQELAGHLNLAAAEREVRVLDLGAGSGVWGIGLAQSSPQVTVTAVDWHAVIPVTRKTATRFGVADRFTFVEGDLHNVDFGSGHDIATLGHILHSEGIELSRKLLARTFHALARGGTIAVQEFLVNHDHTGPVNGLIFAVNMLVNTENGGTYSFEEISGWLGEAGFVNPRTIETHGPSPLILADKE